MELADFCSQPSTAWMCSSPIDVKPEANVNSATHNSTLVTADLKRAILTHVNVSVTSTFILLLGLFILFAIVFILNRVHKAHILDLHSKFHSVKMERTNKATTNLPSLPGES